MANRVLDEILMTISLWDNAVGTSPAKTRAVTRVDLIRANKAARLENRAAAVANFP
jgi:hypothetical protein